MHVTLLGTRIVAKDTYHNAFTSITYWNKCTFIAYRTALSHGIVPPGKVVISEGWEDNFSKEQSHGWASLSHTEITHPIGDVRDPRFITTEEALYCVVGVYLPNPAGGEPYKLSPSPQDNILQTHITHSTDGDTWSPLVPILRPGYWGWSVVSGENRWYMASYHTHLVGQSQSIHLDTSPGLLAGWSPWGCIYDGASLAMDGERFRHVYTLPSEPVLYHVDDTTLGCCVRTEKGMAIGVSRVPYQEWRWWHHRHSAYYVHPSAVLQTPHGFLLAAREIGHDRIPGATLKDARQTRTIYRTSLYHLFGQTLTKVLTLPSELDTGYAGLCATDEEGVYDVSYYTQAVSNVHERFGVVLPGAEVRVARIRVEA